MKVKYKGNARVKKAQLQRLRRDFETLEIKDLTPNFNFVVYSIEESKDMDPFTIDELQSSLLVHEQMLVKKEVEDHALKKDKGVNYVEFDENEELVLMAHMKDDVVANKGYWFLDSACSNQMTGMKNWFTRLDETIRHTVKLGNGLRLQVKGLGDVRFEIRGITQVFTNVYYVPQLTSNLLSVGQLQEKKVKVVVSKDGACYVHHPTRGLIMKSTMAKNRMFIVYGYQKDATGHCLQVTDDNTTHIWHKRFGHVNYKAIRTMQYQNLVKGIPQVCGKTLVCETCSVEKQRRIPIPKKAIWRSTQRLELVHTDLFGPITPTSQSGKKEMESRGN
uniref:Uncharacterized protein n=1 Tax=Tanacetum cinerariifolium TaxID=118510 RepID=A0A699JBB4_TANCI|nr:hypothetical protein [Tanacetum cinerariifolium]